VGSAEHPMAALELGRDPLDRALGAERLAAADAAERLLLFEPARGGASGAKIELRLERDDLFRASRLAQPALHAGILHEPQAGPLRLRHQGPGRTTGHA